MFFSILGVIIVLCLYVLFLGKPLQENLKGLAAEDFLLYTYILSGVLCIASFTTTLGALNLYINDYTLGKQRELFTIPLRRWQIGVSYSLTAMMIGYFLCFACFLGMQFFLLLRGQPQCSFQETMNFLVVLIPSVFCCGGFSFFLVSMIQSSGAYAGLNVVMGTLTGFLAGVYMPMEAMDGWLKGISMVFPITHIGILFRKIFMRRAINEAFRQLHLNQRELFETGMGICIQYQDERIPFTAHCLYLFLCGGVFLWLGILLFSKKHKKL